MCEGSWILLASATYLPVASLTPGIRTVLRCPWWLGKSNKLMRVQQELGPEGSVVRF